MNARQLIAHCRETRGGIPSGDIRDPATLRAVLLELLEAHLQDLAERVPERESIYDLNNGRSVPVGPAPRAPDPRDDSTALALGTLISYVEDLPA